ncbi:MAG: nucleoside recognition domain-containing protein [Rhodothermales bacterium]|jgi:spore maturation protein A
MLNYIWAGLIILSLLFAAVSDIRDFSADTYRNGESLPVTVEFDAPYAPSARRQNVHVTISGDDYASFYGTEAPSLPVFEGVLVQSERGRELRFASGAKLPEPLSTVRDFTAKRDPELLATLHGNPASGDTLFTGGAEFRPVHFVKMNAIGAAALEFAQTAVTIALGLIGVLALWLGLLRIGESAGLIDALVKVVQPVLRPIFPEIPKGHPAMGMIALNMTANMLGLGNAATPMGIKAMEELQTLNSDPETATNAQVTLLALATGSVQLVPPTLLVAVMGLQINQLIFAIIIATTISTTCGVVAAKLLQRTKWYRTSEPKPIGDANGGEA